MTPSDKTLKAIIEMTDEAQTMGELHRMLHDIAYTIGGMVLHFEQDERTALLISLAETMGTALMNTSVAMGEPCDVEMMVGK